MPDPVKAAHYIQQLDDARCDENWDAVPELVRKVRKHAPERTCLALTAEIEHAIAKANLPTDGTSANAGAGGGGLDAADKLPALLTTIDSESHHPEDRFQARVCAGWLQWVLREYAAALARLPRTLHDSDDADHETADGKSEWTKVCALKAAYLRANCLARDGQREGALNAFEAALPGLASVWSAGPAEARQQTRYWAELFLTEYCMLAAQALRDGVRSLKDADCLGCFRTWARYWSAGKGGTAVLSGGYGFRGSVPRRQVWAEYYYALSEILRGDLPFPTGYLDVGTGIEGSARSQLRAELKKVEAVYRGLLFSETKFPKADEERAEVEEFVRRMMQNWEILNGRGWKEHDLGAGGRDSLCHGTLDSLYGAAAKTYHSTAILRHMFTVHLAVAEFDLAFMAFDSWFELVKKGKARVQKTGHREPALDDDARMFETISACIAALCRFGSREAADKAHKLAEELEDLVKNKEEGRDADCNDLRDEVPPNILALAWQSIGLAQAQWARMTYESESRESIQQKAIQCLRRSLSPEFGPAIDAGAAFALGILYAEQRELSAAIELVRTALLAEKAVKESQELLLGPYWRERSLIPLWHLLALMLSARQEYFMAARACEGAIEQFKDPYVLFGSRHLNGAYRSEHLKEAGLRNEKAGDGIVDEMDDYEKEGILQIKMTQLAILELIEGPAVAVNASTELLTLFPRLFGDLEQNIQDVELSKAAEPPKTTATMRTIRGSVFGGKADRSTRARQNTDSAAKLETIESRPQTTQTVQSVATTTLTRQSTNADPDSSRRSIKSDDFKRRSRNSLRKRDRSGSRQRAVSSGGPPVPPLDGSKYFAPADERNLPQYFAPKQTVEPPRMSSQLEGSRMSSPRSRATTSHSELAPVAQVVGSFTPLLPYVHFSPEHNRRRRKAILVKVWLVIAGFYRRAGLLDDAHKAIDEAQKVAQSLEADVVSDTSGSLSMRQAGWGMEKSVEEVLADVWAEKGHLSLAREKPYQARAEFEAALTHFPDHPSAIIGLSHILLDIYTEELLPPPAVPGLDLSGLPLVDDDSVFASPTDRNMSPIARNNNMEDSLKFPPLPSAPLGLGPTTTTKPTAEAAKPKPAETNGRVPSPSTPPSDFLGPQLPPPHKATSLPLNDRLAARDRAYGLLSGLTKLGSGWNDAEAWLALARAYEESGQVEKARDALWWCVELEDGRGVRDWNVVTAGGGYVL